MEPKDRIVVALDVDNTDSVERLVSSLAPHVGCFKIGLELMTAVGGLFMVKFIHRMGGKVFYDGKFSDIPTTVGRASKAVTDLKVAMFNVHANCGKAAMKEAVANRGDSLALAVTLLTSIDVNETMRIYDKLPTEVVYNFLCMASDAEMNGIICSPQELPIIQAFGNTSLLTVVPGVRPTWAAANDQKRIATPAETIRAGADYVVIGRPITNPPTEIGSPVEAAKCIAAEIASAL